MILPLVPTELAREPLLCAQSVALELETEVQAGDMGLETAHRAQLVLLPVSFSPPLLSNSPEFRAHPPEQWQLRHSFQLVKYKPMQ